LRASGEIIARSQSSRQRSMVLKHIVTRRRTPEQSKWYDGWWKGVVIKGCIYLMTMMCHLHRSL